MMVAVQAQIDTHISPGILYDACSQGATTNNRQDTHHHHHERSTTNKKHTTHKSEQACAYLSLPFSQAPHVLRPILLMDSSLSLLGLAPRLSRRVVCQSRTPEKHSKRQQQRWRGQSRFWPGGGMNGNPE